MAGRGSQLSGIQPVGSAALNPPHPHRDGDLAYIMENWPRPDHHGHAQDLPRADRAGPCDQLPAGQHGNGGRRCAYGARVRSCLTKGSRLP